MLVVGINHHKTRVDHREKLTFDDGCREPALKALMCEAWVEEAMIISTCNRSEIYIATEKTDEIHKQVERWWCDYLNIKPEDAKCYFFHYWDDQAIHHLSRVAAGLDSMVVGEPQILGQVKQAYSEAQAANSLGQLLKQVVPHSFNVAKRVRTDTDIGANPVSVAYAAITLAKRIFNNIGTSSALLIGAGEMISLVARHLADQGVKKITILNRTPEKAAALAEPLQGKYGDLSQIISHLAEADILVSCTGSPVPLVQSDDVKAALKLRKYRPIYMVDLAVPRDITPDVNDFEDVYLFTIDDLQEVIDENRQARFKAAVEAEAIAEQATQVFMRQMRIREASDVIAEYRAKSDKLRQDILVRAQKKLHNGEQPEAVLDFLSRALMNKMIHAPTVAMRKALEDSNLQALNWSREMLGLSCDDSHDTGRDQEGFDKHHYHEKLESCKKENSKPENPNGYDAQEKFSRKF